MPTLKVGSASQVNGAALAAFLRPVAAAGAHGYVEKVSAMPDQGVTGVFNFGHATGSATTVLSVLGIAYTLVTPAVWKKRAGLIGQDKDAARTRAIQLWPWWRELDLKGKGQAFADAAFIAYYGHQDTSIFELNPTPRRKLKL